MMKFLILLLCIVLLPLTISSQGIKITDEKVQEVIDKLEEYPVELIEVKTIKKWKALNLSNKMKSRMNYNVVLVKYKTQDTFKAILIDMHLVPIQYDFKRSNEKKERKNDFALRF